MGSPFQRYSHLGSNYQSKLGLSCSGEYLHCLTQAHKIDTFYYPDIVSASNPSGSDSTIALSPHHSLTIAQGCGIQNFVPSPGDIPGYFVSCAQHPIQLWNLALPDSTDSAPTARIVASYAFNDNKHEAVHSAYLALAKNGDPHLIAAGARFIRVYDVSYGSRDPLHDIRLFLHGQTGSSALDARALKGPVSCLDAQGGGLLAVGTVGGQVGVFADNGAGGLVCALGAGREREDGMVTQVRWSEARPWYLYVGRRGRDRVRVYDLRAFSWAGERSVGTVGAGGPEQLALGGWKNDTTMRLSFDLLQVGDAGYEHEIGEWLLAGTSDGRVVGWKDPWAARDGGGSIPDWELEVDRERRLVTAVLAHPDGTLVTGCGEDWRKSTYWWDAESSSSSDDESMSGSEEQSSENGGSSDGDEQISDRGQNGDES